GGCRVTVGGETKFVCVDGPEFDGHLVDWDGMMARLRSYKAMEEEAHHACHLRQEADRLAAEAAAGAATAAAAGPAAAGAPATGGQAPKDAAKGGER
ncbi:MAG TPA: hypothetical protein P5165_05340, partial [Spirochaetia bacterium]|nr:hypothetical protein [Spirochaetia bacterium]